MINPLPIELRPDFLERVSVAKDKGEIDWLWVILASGACFAIIYIGCKKSKDSSIKKVQLCAKNNKLQCCCQNQPSRCNFCSAE